MTNPLKIVRMVGMYGTCRDIEAYAGTNNFAGAHFSAGERIWYVSVHNRDGSITNYDLHHADADEGCMARVEAIFRLAYRSNYSPVKEVA